MTDKHWCNKTLRQHLELSSCLLSSPNSSSRTDEPLTWLHTQWSVKGCQLKMKILVPTTTQESNLHQLASGTWFFRAGGGGSYCAKRRVLTRFRRLMCVFVTCCRLFAQKGLQREGVTGTLEQPPATPLDNLQLEAVTTIGRCNHFLSQWMHFHCFGSQRCLYITWGSISLN